MFWGSWTIEFIKSGAPKPSSSPISRYHPREWWRLQTTDTSVRIEHFLETDWPFHFFGNSVLLKRSWYTNCGRRQYGVTHSLRGHEFGLPCSDLVLGECITPGRPLDRSGERRRFLILVNMAGDLKRSCTTVQDLSSPPCMPPSRGCVCQF